MNYSVSTILKIIIVSTSLRLSLPSTLQIFNTMRVECPELLEKVHPIRADYSAIDLDIDAADRAMLSSEVQVSCRCCDAVMLRLPTRRIAFLSGFVGFCSCVFVVVCACWQFNQWTFV